MEAAEIVDININFTVRKIPDKDGATNQLLREFIHMATIMNETLQHLTAQVERLITVDESAIALIQGLKEQLDEAIDTGDMDEVQALSDRIGESTDALAAAVAANTPAAPTEPVPTDPPAGEPEPIIET